MHGNVPQVIHRLFKFARMSKLSLIKSHADILYRIQERIVLHSYFCQSLEFFYRQIYLNSKVFNDFFFILGLSKFFSS